jgi:alpha-maltose-1-phosphate synthase
MRVLFFNEGNLGTHVLGHAQLDEALRSGLSGMPDFAFHFAELSAMGRLADIAVNHSVEPLRRYNLDLHTLRWHAVQSLRARRALKVELNAWPADVLHVYSHAVAFAIGGTMRKLPVVLSTDTTVHDWWGMPAWRPAQRYAPLTIAGSRRLERRALASAALVLGRTAWTCAALEREAPSARVVEHHPGIDLDRYRPVPRRERERPRVLFVGGRFVEKGGLDLLAALEGRLGRDVELDIVTPGELPAIEGVRVHRMMPGDPALLDLQQQADVMCLPTLGDTNPWSILEAMACGTPVVSTRIGGIPDMLEDGRAGVLVDHSDRRALGEALDGLLADDARRTELGGRARARCERHYDARHQAARLVEHLRSVFPASAGQQRTPAASDGGLAASPEHEADVVEAHGAEAE